MKNKSLVILWTACLTAIALISCVLFLPRGGALKFEPDKLPDLQVGMAYGTNVPGQTGEKEYSLVVEK